MVPRDMTSDTQRSRVFFLGIAAQETNNGEVEACICSRIGSFRILSDIYTIHYINDMDKAEQVTSCIMWHIRSLEARNKCKYTGAGINETTKKITPSLPTRLWDDLDIVPMIFDSALESREGWITERELGEQASIMALECLSHFDHNEQPRILLGERNEVQVDCGGRVQWAVLDRYKEDVSKNTWIATLKYAEALRIKNIKIAFFSSTPEDGIVAPMRHALVRFLKLLGIDVNWYVLEPQPEVSSIAKANDNILRGLSGPNERLKDGQLGIIAYWAEQNAISWWISDDGPLAPRHLGGADFIIIDDSQIPNLVKIAKELDPFRPVVWRSHFQLCSSPVDNPFSAFTPAYTWLYSHVQFADVFIMPPIPTSILMDTVPGKVGRMSTTIDWLDGRNKSLSWPQTLPYIAEINAEARHCNMPQLRYPYRGYFVQITYFASRKCTADTITSYALYLRRNTRVAPNLLPQLIIVGQGSTSDPDTTRIFEDTVKSLSPYPELAGNVIVLRLPAKDQLLNALVANANAVIQPSDDEAFNVKILEALRKRVPVVAQTTPSTRRQIRRQETGLIAEAGDCVTIAKRLQALTNSDHCKRMGELADNVISDETGTVGNALCWLYLADKLTNGESVTLNGHWVFDLASEGAEQEWIM